MTIKEPIKLTTLLSNNDNDDTNNKEWIIEELLEMLGEAGLDLKLIKKEE